MNSNNVRLAALLLFIFMSHLGSAIAVISEQGNEVFPYRAEVEKFEPKLKLNDVVLIAVRVFGSNDLEKGMKIGIIREISIDGSYAKIILLSKKERTILWKKTMDLIPSISELKTGYGYFHQGDRVLQTLPVDKERQILHLFRNGFVVFKDQPDAVGRLNDSYVKLPPPPSFFAQCWDQFKTW